MKVLRHSPRDAALLAAVAALGVVEAAFVPWLVRHGLWGMGACTIAAIVWWTSNTVAHVHLHTPLLRPRALSRLLSLYLGALTLIPQSIWRARHLAHHRGEPPGPVRLDARACLEIGLVAHLALALALVVPDMFFGAVVPGWALGLGLCQLQGQGEHLGGRAAGISHYGRIYNLLWFNDGYHAEHHRWPGAHWTTLPARRLTGAAHSPAPPVLRAAPVAAALVWLERAALRSPRLQRWLVARHAAAFRRLAPRLAARPIRRVVVVGGGLFPRSVLALGEIWPEAQVTILDADAAHLERARVYLAAHGRCAELVHGRYEPGAPLRTATHTLDPDLIVVPLALIGDREALYAGGDPPRLVHDWLWRRRGPASAIVSPWLLKRVNLVLA